MSTSAMDQSTRSSSEGRSVEDLQLEDLPLVVPRTRQRWHKWITVHIRKKHVVNLLKVLVPGFGGQKNTDMQTLDGLKYTACHIEGLAYRLSETPGEYTKDVTLYANFVIKEVGACRRRWADHAAVGANHSAGINHFPDGFSHHHPPQTPPSLGPQYTSQIPPSFGSQGTFQIPSSMGLQDPSHIPPSMGLQDPSQILGGAFAATPSVVKQQVTDELNEIISGLGNIGLGGGALRG